MAPDPNDCTPNIAPAGIRRRQRFGLQWAGISIAAAGAGMIFRAPWIARAAVFLPAALSATGFLQASRNTCVLRAKEGTMEHDDFSTAPAPAVGGGGQPQGRAGHHARRDPDWRRCGRARRRDRAAAVRPAARSRRRCRRRRRPRRDRRRHDRAHRSRHPHRTSHRPRKANHSRPSSVQANGPRARGGRGRSSPGSATAALTGRSSATARRSGSPTGASSSRRWPPRAPRQRRKRPRTPRASIAL